nr:MAG: hypothetical protein [Bacteriophage sp.]
MNDKRNDFKRDNNDINKRNNDDDYKNKMNDNKVKDGGRNNKAVYRKGFNDKVESNKAKVLESRFL